jgi:hypothetical protein
LCDAHMHHVFASWAFSWAHAGAPAANTTAAVHGISCCNNSNHTLQDISEAGSSCTEPMPMLATVNTNLQPLGPCSNACTRSLLHLACPRLNACKSIIRPHTASESLLLLHC